ncbi:MAG: putative glycolipid-binding domain-containing protein [Nitriliruptoraceae bacterium]
MERAPLQGLQLRAARDKDADGLIRLVGAAYAEYPGCVLDLPGVDDDLPAPATTAARRGGRWWVLETDDEVVGSIGTGAPQADGTLELKRCYLDARWRGRGLATRLIRRVEEHAAALGVARIVLWSDTRFTAAHHRYQQLGYELTGETRELHDPSDTTEYRFVCAVPPATDPAPVRFAGPDGDDEVVARALPDGSVLRGQVGDARYELEVDHAWRPRRAVLADGPAPRRQLSSDGQGRWWLDGDEATHLNGCTDVGLPITPTALQAVVRRMALGAGEQGLAQLAVLGGPAQPVTTQAVTWSRHSAYSYTRQVGDDRTVVEVDRFGLPVRVGDRWRRTTPVDE